MGEVERVGRQEAKTKDERDGKGVVRVSEAMGEERREGLICSENVLAS